MSLKVFTFVIAALALAGCSASGPIFKQYTPQKSDSAILYIYRPQKTVNCCVAPAVYIDGATQHALKNGGYHVYELPAGNYEVIVGDGSYGFTAESIELKLEQSNHYYLKWNIGPIENLSAVITGAILGGATSGQREYNLVQMDPATAKQEISSLKLSMPQP